jgi:hypothetical protein
MYGRRSGNSGSGARLEQRDGVGTTRRGLDLSISMVNHREAGVEIVSKDMVPALPATAGDKVR